MYLASAPIEVLCCHVNILAIRSMNFEVRSFAHIIPKSNNEIDDTHFELVSVMVGYKTVCYFDAIWYTIPGIMRYPL